jgi:rRNA processing protein Gar1
MDKLRYIVREIVKRQMREANVTGNLDGGEGPVKTPYAFSKKKDGDKKKKLKHAKKVYGYTKAKRNPKLYKKFGA